MFLRVDLWLFGVLSVTLGSALGWLFPRFAETFATEPTDFMHFFLLTLLVLRVALCFWLTRSPHCSSKQGFQVFQISV